jgi:predicted nucleic acid-binding protein
MIVYVDTSVVLRVLLHEPNPVGIWGQWNKAYSSALWRVEALRTVDRLRLTHEISDNEVAELVRDIQITHETFAIHPITNQVLQRASETFPTVVGTLDAMDLATAPVDTRNRKFGFSVDPRFSALHRRQKSRVRGYGNRSVKKERR